MYTRKRKALCELLARVPDDLRDELLDNITMLASAYPSERPSWECCLSPPKKARHYVANFERRKVVKPKYILLVDDDEALSDSLKSILESESSVHVTIATDGHTAVNLLRHNSFNILFIDISLDKSMSGLDVLRFASEFQPTARPYIITGYDRHAYREQAKEYGAIDYIVKPFDPELLLQIITT